MSEITEAEVEAATSAVSQAYVGLDASAYNDVSEMTGYHRRIAREYATAALAAVEPLIRERLAQEVELGCYTNHPITNERDVTELCARCTATARIVRGDAS